MRAVTIVKGEWYARMADLSVPLFEASTGLTVELVELSGDADPFREKLRLTERYPDGFVFFDADCLFLLPWCVLTPSKLSMARGVRWRKCPWNALEHVYNTGVMLVPPGCAELFSLALSRFDAMGRDYFDEGHLRAAIHELDWPVEELDKRLNWQRQKPPPPDAVVWHVVGNRSDPARKFQLMRDALNSRQRLAS